MHCGETILTKNDQTDKLSQTQNNLSTNTQKHILPHPTNSAYNARIYQCAQLEGADTPLPPTNSAYNAGIYRCAQLEGAEDKEFRFVTMLYNKIVL